MPQAGLSRVINVRGHTFFPGQLNGNSVIVDLGANRGEFSMEMIRRFGLNSWAVEASPIMFESLPTNPKFHPFNFAVTDKECELTFNLGENPEASSIHVVAFGAAAGTVNVTGKRLSTFLQEQNIRRIDLLKVDIEGAEIGLFSSSSDELLRSIPQISIEFHDFCGQITTAEVEAVVDRLERLGFYGIKLNRTNENWLFVQPKLTKVGVIQLAYVKYAVRNVQGVGRMVSRALGKG